MHDFGVVSSSRWRGWVLGFAVFLLPALSIAVPSGYSWGAGLLVLLGIAAWPGALRHLHAWPRDLHRWALCAGGMGLVWTLHTYVDGQWLMRTLGVDRSLKYLLLLLALPAVLGGLPRIDALRWGCWVGALLAGAMAAWQWLWLGLDRAAGHTNAIQFGNLALLLALWSWIWVRASTTGIERMVGYAAVLAGGFASLASGSRGGWLVAPVLVALVWWLDRQGSSPARRDAPRGRVPRWAKAALGALLLCLAAALLPPVQQRVNEAVSEVQAFRTQGQSMTSVGHRLAHWQLAWRLGLERPWLGWGQVDYEARKHAAVVAGETPPVVEQFNHAHNEWLDMFAKRGLVGVLALAAFLAIPGACYARALRQPAGDGLEVRERAALCGLVLVVGFAGFGLTQVMFAHNNGNMMYLFMNLLWLAALVRPASQLSSGDHAH